MKFATVVLLKIVTVAGAEEKKVAGRTMKGWAADLDSTNEFVRLRAVKSLGPFGADAIEPLRKALDDESAGVRYWAASHLGAIGRKASDAVERLKELKADKKNPAVAMSAAFALCRVDSVKKHIELLISRLDYPERGMACAAAEFLGRLGSAGKFAIPALERTFKKHARSSTFKGKDYHINGAAQNALRKIQPGWQAK